MSTSTDSHRILPPPLILLISFFTILVIGTIIFSTYIENHTNESFIPLMNYALKITNEITEAHLWLEEILNYDSTESIDSVWRHLDRATDHAKVFLDQGQIISNNPLLHNAEIDTILDSEITKTIEEIVRFRSIAADRYAEIQSRKAGSIFDLTMDTLYQHAIRHPNNALIRLQLVVRQRFNLFRLVQYILIFISLLLSVLITVVLYRYNKKQSELLSSLDASNQQLKASNQQLRASEQQLKASNQQLRAGEQQVKAANQQLSASEQQLRASNQQLLATEQQLRATNQQLSVSELQFRSLFAGMNEGVCLHELVYDDSHEAVNYRIIDINPAYEQILGLKREETVGILATEVYKTDTAPYLESFAHVALTGNSAFMETYFPPMDKHFSISIFSPGKDKFATVFTDISQQKKSEKAIKELGARNEAILSAITDIIMEVDNNKVYTWANNAGIQFFGNDVLGKEAGEYFEGEQETYSIVKPVFEGDDNVIYVESWQRRKDGEKRLLSWCCKSLRDAEGNITGAISCARDITEQRRIEEQLYQTGKMEAIGQLAGGIAHDFNNQLAGIMGYADLLRECLINDKDLYRYADMIITATKRSANLTDQLLAFARKGKYLNAPINLHKIINEVISLLEHTIDKRIKIKQNLYANPPMVNGDPSQIQNAILNLALNARDAMPNGGDLIFTTDILFLEEEYCKTNAFEIEPGKYLQISVTDTGIGMDTETKKHVFEPFFTTKEPGKGTGMGLASVYGTVKNHKGTINLYSEPGFGSTFKLCLPLLNTESRDDETDAPVIIRGQARIMVIDDEIMILDIVNEMLKSIDYHVTTFASGSSAIAFYKDNWRDIDLVILDMVMPEMGGYDTFMALKQINPAIRALLSSGYSMDNESQRIIKAGVLDFIQKPYQKAALSQKIAAALRST